MAPPGACLSCNAAELAVCLQSQKLAAENDKLRGEISLLRGEQQALAAELHGWQARWQASVVANRNLMEHICLMQPQGSMVCPRWMMWPNLRRL